MRAFPIIFSLLLVVVLSGCTGTGTGAQANNTSYFNQTGNNFGGSPACQNIANVSLRATCLASTSGSLSYCDSIVASDQKDSCYAYSAVTLKDISTCGRISSEGIRENCEELTLYSLAVNRSDPSFCANISYFAEGYLRNCYIDLAYQKKKFSICDSLDANSSKICRWEIIDQPLSGSWDYDLVKLSDYLSLFSESDCARAIDSSDQLICQAVATRNQAGCDYFRTDNFITKYNANVTAAEIAYNMCLRDMVLVTKDASLCDLASTGKGQCLETVSLLSKDPSVLDGLNYSKYLAVSEIAIYWKDASICSAAGNTTEQQLCLSYFYLGEGNSTYCSSLKSGPVRDSCFATAAKNSGDVSFCKQIEDESAKDLCYLKNSLSLR